jgi:hypothetical protein
MAQAVRDLAVTARSGAGAVEQPRHQCRLQLLGGRGRAVHLVDRRLDLGDALGEGLLQCL